VLLWVHKEQMMVLSHVHVSLLIFGVLIWYLEASNGDFFLRDRSVAMHVEEAKAKLEPRIKD
jgi:hypothetical protein